MFNMTIGLVVFACVAMATLLVAKVILWLAPSSNGLAASGAGLLFIVGSLGVLWWMNRQARQWWDRF